MKLHFHFQLQMFPEICKKATIQKIREFFLLSGMIDGSNKEHNSRLNKMQK